jgi:nitric-oxide synthase
VAEAFRHIERFGTYQHTRDELAYGVRLAWRGHARVADRAYWRGVHVRDRRHVRRPADVAADVTVHLAEALNGGRIRPAVTVFAPDAPMAPGPRIWTWPLPSHAGHLRADGTMIGDPGSMVMTATVRRLGWSVVAPGEFDPLPLVVAVGGGRPHLRPLSGSAVEQVPIRHPRFRWFADLGLRWPALASVSLGGAEPGSVDIGGVHYPAAPAHGWHLGASVARHLADPDGYDTLPELGYRLGLEVGYERTLWRDRALLELNIAILHSFDRAGITIADHRTEAALRRRGARPKTVTVSGARPKAW